MSRTIDTQSQHVLVALDGSPAAATALPVARVLAGQLGVPVRALHVAPNAIDSPVVDTILGSLMAGESITVLRAPDGVAAGLLAAGLDPEVALLVLTTHGRQVASGRQLGNTASTVLARSTRPILVARPEASPPPRPVHRLLLPLDGAPATAAVLAPTTELARRLGASLDVLYVASAAQPSLTEPGSMGAPRYVDQPQHEWPAWAREFLDRFCICLGACPPEVDTRLFLSQGDVAAEIVQFAETHAEDAIVLVRKSRLQRGRARILRAALNRTTCPILLVGTSS